MEQCCKIPGSSNAKRQTARTRKAGGGARSTGVLLILPRASCSILHRHAATPVSATDAEADSLDVLELCQSVLALLSSHAALLDAAKWRYLLTGSGRFTWFGNTSGKCEGSKAKTDDGQDGGSFNHPCWLSFGFATRQEANARCLTHSQPLDACQRMQRRRASQRHRSSPRT